VSVAVFVFVASRADPSPGLSPGHAPAAAAPADLGHLSLLSLVPTVAAAASWAAASIRGIYPAAETDTAVLPTRPGAAATKPQAVDPTATPTLARQPRPTATLDRPAGARRLIVNTDGIGVALRQSRDGPQLQGEGYDEGVTVAVLGEQGAWAHIRGEDGRDGWVLAVTVRP
jgi:hypothetical protein